MYLIGENYQKIPLPQRVGLGIYVASRASVSKIHKFNVVVKMRIAGKTYVFPGQIIVTEKIV
jgi:hypothetical protein